VRSINRAGTARCGMPDRMGGLAVGLVRDSLQAATETATLNTASQSPVCRPAFKGIALPFTVHHPQLDGNDVERLHR
jgi:hypothetical protein